MSTAYLNQIATAVPPYDIHRKFVEYAPRMLADARTRALFGGMAQRAQIESRYSFLKPAADKNILDEGGFYKEGEFPGTESRMRFFKKNAFTLARMAFDQIDLKGVTHILVTTCTGFYAPGLDLKIIDHYGLAPSVERTMIGFMGCYAAISALKLARHIVRSDEAARVLILNLELCTLHLKESASLQDIKSFLIFADGCSASIVSSDPCGMELKSFKSCIMPGSAEQITWVVGDIGFDMNLSHRVPATIGAGIPGNLESILDGCSKENITHWAIHPGGRSIIDAVRDAAGLGESAMSVSRDILRRYGNMSSATMMFVLAEMMRSGEAGEGCAMAFGPGLTLESMRFKNIEAA
jgi:alpha-pyrone synthase